MDEEQERKSFERHLSLSGISLGKRNEDGAYIGYQTESLWLGWSARAELSQPASPAPEAPTVEQAIAALVAALAASKGWMRDYADSVVRDAIDRRVK